MTGQTQDTAAVPEVSKFEIGDRISDAYYGEMGESFARKVRQRVHWIAEQVEGHSVLDIGCSQGIGCILLGREGHQVEGVDIDAGAIDRAQDYLAHEPESVRENVTFRNADFMGVDFDDRRFSTIVMGEVLEHLVRPQAFIARAHDLLEPQGRIVVTVPFGINDFPDHKRTFYLAEMTRLLHPHFSLSTPRYFGHWIGFSGTRRDAPETGEPSDLPLREVSRLEAAFLELERDLVDRVTQLKAVHKGLINQKMDALAKTKDALATTKAAAAETKSAAAETKAALAEKARAVAVQVELRKDLAASRKENAALEGRIKTLEQDKATLTKAMVARVQDIAALGLRLEALAAESRALYDSTSWAVTRPLRAISRRLWLRR